MATPFPLGRLPDPPDPHDRPLSEHVRLMAAGELPASHASLTLPVLNQGGGPECVAFSGSTYRTAQEKFDEGHTIAWREHDFYARCKAVDGLPGAEGTYLRAGCRVLKGSGEQIRASSVPGEVGKFRRIAAYVRLTTPPEIKQAILQTHGAWLGLNWYDSWFFPPASGVLPRPDTYAGGHAVYVGGWSDSQKVWICQNSWGRTWARSGQFLMPYAYLHDQVDDRAADLWAITDVLGDVSR